MLILMMIKTRLVDQLLEMSIFSKVIVVLLYLDVALLDELFVFFSLFFKTLSQGLNLSV
mgnify:CR=1 FL=1